MREQIFLLSNFPFTWKWNCSVFSLACSTYAQAAIKLHFRGTVFILSFFYEYQSLQAPVPKHKHEMSFKSILQPNPEQKSSIENIHNKSVLHPTPCLEKQSSKVINNIPQVLLLSWVATSLSCPCLHCLNTEWFALDWSLLDGWAAERQHQKIRGKNQNYSKIVCLQPWCCKSTGRLWSPSYTCRNQFLSGVPSPLTTHKYQSGKGTQLHCAHRGHCWAVPGTRWSGNKLLDVKEKTQPQGTSTDTFPTSLQTAGKGMFLAVFLISPSFHCFWIHFSRKLDMGSA